MDKHVVLLYIYKYLEYKIMFNTYSKQGGQSISPVEAAN